MPQPATAKQRALRALAEGARATLELLADVSGRQLETLRRDAEREKWRLGRASREEILARIRENAAMLLDQVEALNRAAMENGGRIDKERLDAIIVAIRGLEKIGDVMLPEEAAEDKQNDRDEDTAAMLRRIDDRIIELARELAEEMVAERGGFRGSPADPK
jgi:hypothetical protein